MSKIIGAVEIGTSFAKVLIGELSEDKSLNIVGKSFRKNEGLRKGEIIDFRKTASSVHAAIDEAEKMSGTTVDSIYLGPNGVTPKRALLKGSANVASPDGRVTHADLKRAADEANANNLRREGLMFIMLVCPFNWMEGPLMIQLE